MQLLVTSYPPFSSLSEHITNHNLNYNRYIYIILTLLIKLKPITSLNHLLQDAYDLPRNE